MESRSPIENNLDELNDSMLDRLDIHSESPKFNSSSRYTSSSLPGSSTSMLYSEQNNYNYDQAGPSSYHDPSYLPRRYVFYD